MVESDADDDGWRGWLRRPYYHWGSQDDGADDDAGEGGNRGECDVKAVMILTVMTMVVMMGIVPVMHMMMFGDDGDGCGKEMAKLAAG